MIEPVRADEIQPRPRPLRRRGRGAARTEWRLITETHNLLKAPPTASRGRLPVSGVLPASSIAGNVTTHRLTRDGQISRRPASEQQRRCPLDDVYASRSRPEGRHAGAEVMSATPIAAPTSDRTAIPLKCGWR